MRKILLIAVALVAAISNTIAQEKTMVVNGLTRNYIQYVPSNLGERPALLISCHGMNQDAAYQKGMLSIEKTADKEKFVVVFPNGIDRGWDLGGDKDINFMLAIIDKMVEEYGVDRDRVYMSGFSMGGMFTYYCMNKIADKIAAFAPISGYPMYGASFTSSRPVPIIHTHGTGDDVCTFDRVQGTLDGWIKRNNCNTTAKVTKSYGGYGHITRREWSGGTNGVKVVLMELANKGHWVSNDGLYTGDEIWKFCKSYSLTQKGPKAAFTYPSNDETTPNAFTAEVNATDIDGNITQVSFYLDNKLLGRVTEAPYRFDVKSLKDGSHTLTVLVNDDNNYKGNASVKFTVDGSITGVEEVKLSPEQDKAENARNNGTVYQLNGQPAGEMQSGQIYIVNGNKIRK